MELNLRSPRELQTALEKRDGEPHKGEPPDALTRYELPLAVVPLCCSLCYSWANAMM